MSGKQAAKVAAKQIAQKTLDDMREQYGEELRQRIREDPRGTYQASMRAVAHNELRESIDQSRQAGSILQQHEDSAVWNYEKAETFWTAYNESMTDDILWTQVRIETIPSGVPEDQLQQIAINFIDGTGVPASTFVDLIQSGQMGEGYATAVNKTAPLRSEFHDYYISFSKVSPLIQQQALEEYGDSIVLENESR